MQNYTIMPALSAVRHAATIEASMWSIKENLFRRPLCQYCKGDRCCCFSVY